MSNSILFYTQILSVLTYIGIALGLYGLLVKQKDATIEFLQRQLDAARQESPDILLKNLSERITIGQQEIERLSKDKETSLELRETLIAYSRNQSKQISLLNDLARYYEEQVAIVEKYLPRDSKSSVTFPPA